VIYGNDLDGDGIPDKPEEGSAFGQDERVQHLQHRPAALRASDAVAMLRPLPSRMLVYFASNLRLNGVSLEDLLYLSGDFGHGSVDQQSPAGVFTR